MPPRKVKVVSMGTELVQTIEQSPTVILNEHEEVEEQPHPDPPASPPPQQPQPDQATDLEDNPLLDTEEIDTMLEEVKRTKEAFMMASIMTKKQQDEKADDKEECINCGKVLSKKSLKYSHSKTCKGLQPIDIPTEAPPEPEPIIPEPVKPKRTRTKAAPQKPEVKVEPPPIIKAKTAAEMLTEQREQRRQLRQTRISLLASQAF
jgi:hypothetical protein